MLHNESNRGRAIVVVSALGGITDTLIECGELAAAGNEEYKTRLTEIEQRHLDAVKELIPIQQQSATLSLVKKNCNELEDICNGVFLLGEISARTKDRIVSYGELLSSQIIAAAFNAAGYPAAWKDARELIRTNSDFGKAVVDFKQTDAQVAAFMSAADNRYYPDTRFYCF